MSPERLSDGDLGQYLNDHRAGATAAIELLETLAAAPQRGELATFAAAILFRVRSDLSVLDQLIDAVGAPNALKRAAGWLVQKVARAKVPGYKASVLGDFQALEIPMMGIVGKRAMWEALASLAREDLRLVGTDFDALAEGANEQLEQVNIQRLRLAAAALGSS